MRIFIMRHAKYTYSLTDYQTLKNGPMPSGQGMTEMQAFAKKIAKRPFAEIYANHASRSRISARIIAKANIRHPRVTVSGLIDPMKVNYEGADIVAHVKDAKTRSRTGERWLEGELPSIEPLGDFMARVSRFFLQVIAAHKKDDEVLVVAHWETFAVADALFQGTPVKKTMKAHDAFKYNRLYEFHV